MQDRGEYIRRIACRLIDNWAARSRGLACPHYLASHPDEEITEAFAMIRSAGMEIDPALASPSNVLVKT